ncbi:MAG: recombination protein O N-terminal domain-containing protein, partial [Planctomycetota bacterium]|nr:recombination protein O N-terminal domain-containing protein [Planctomycetota bacterium]
MAALKTEAIVLRRRIFSESSLVVALLGRDGGRLDVLAKGCRREKSPLFGHLDVFQRESVLVLERPQAGLDLLLEAGFVDEYAGLRFLPPAFAAAGLLTNLAADAALPDDSQAGLFDILARALGILSDLGEASAQARLSPPLPFSPAGKEALVGLTLKLALLDMLDWFGFGIELRRCVGCGLEPESGRDAWLDRRQGGLLCRKCRSKAGEARSIGYTALLALRERGDGSEKREMALPPAERRRWL